MNCEVHLGSVEIEVSNEENTSEDLYGAMDEFHHSAETSSCKDWEFKLVRPQIGCVSMVSKVDLPSSGLGKSDDDFTQPEPYTEELDVLFSPLQNSLSQDDGSLDNVGDEKGVPGICGLKNLGNTCFMGAGVQCLVATAPLVYSLVTTPDLSPNSLVMDLTELSKQIWSGQFNTLHPGKFKNAIATYFPHFTDFRQHDCQEFLAMLLDRLHEEMNSARSKDVGCQAELQEHQIYDDNKTPSTSSKSQPLIGLENSLKMDNGDFSDPHECERPTEGCKPLLSINRSTGMELEALNDESSHSNSNLSENCDSTCDNNSLNNISSEGMCTKKEDVCLLNNTVNRFGDLQDIIKDAKTSNVNVLVMEQEANNEIRFDSEKFPKVETSRRRVGSFNLNSFHLYENNTSTKRCKSTVTHFSSGADLKEGLDLKRVKLNCEEQLAEKNQKMEMERKNKACGSMLIEKNQRMESERKGRAKAINEAVNNTDRAHNAVPSSSTGSLLLEDKAEQHWEKHLTANRSVIVETFQGQFKSTVVCSICEYVSVTYEPFMYLSVPLPNALLIQLTVFFVGESYRDGMKLIIEVNKYDPIAVVKEKILSLIGIEIQEPVVLAEVLEHHVSRILDGSNLVKDTKEKDRELYAFEALSILGKDFDTEPKGEDDMEERCCTICLEEKENNMKRHIGCSCIICDLCIATSCQHYGGPSLECPICRKEAFPEVDFIPLKPSNRVTVRMMYIPLVFRMDTSGDGNNNQKVLKLFGHPMLLWLPSKCSGDELHSAINNLINYPQPYKLLLVDGQGLHCSRCMFYSHCKGCPVSASETVEIRSSDTLAVCFSDTTIEETKPIHHSSVNVPPLLPLTLNDCVQAFSKSETLDDNNPWFCPQCSMNRCATKTLTVCRYPDYLIVYLKRFVFLNNFSTKLDDRVSFPLVGLELPHCDSPFDLYACVCHVGGVSAGHYTSYTQHPYSGEWHYFNDCCVTSQAPQEEDYSNAYILFYRKRGVEIPHLDLEGSPAECI